jgi:hypothetical protein
LAYCEGAVVGGPVAAVAAVVVGGAVVEAAVVGAAGTVVGAAVVAAPPAGTVTATVDDGAGRGMLVTEPDSAAAVPLGLELGPLPLSRSTTKPRPMAKMIMTRPPTAMRTRRSRS